MMMALMITVASTNTPPKWGYSSFAPAVSPYGFYQNPHWFSAYPHNPYPIASDYPADKYLPYNPVDGNIQVISLQK
jgi:hypothetical protein